MFQFVFCIVTMIAALLFYYTKTKVETTSNDPAFRSFQKTYYGVYLLAVAGDWLQGPHVYALYQLYGMTKHQIEILFIAGFGSSLIFGTFVGAVADKFGRRWNCFLYGILYGASCITKHFPFMSILLIGRLLGGIATSILYSAFESWLLYEHSKRGFNEQQLGTILSNASVGNSIVAILAGIVAQFAADQFGYVAPFDLSLIVLGCMAFLVLKSWPENYGNERAPVKESFIRATELLRSDHRVLCLGLVQALFEGAMYTFVLEWTPALTQAAPIGSTIPHGLIFASFMVATMIGSSLFTVLTKLTSVENVMRFVLLVASLCLTVPLCLPFSLEPVFIAFIIFEMCVGIFWPSMAYLRGVYLPEETRSTTINMFRIPLNLIVIFILYQNLAMHTIFQFCSLFLLMAATAQHFLYSWSSSHSHSTEKELLQHSP